jgi:hypothetical protein
MTVAELITELTKLSPTLRVVTRGYEGRYRDVSKLEPLDLALNVHTEQYYGPHKEWEEGRPKCSGVLI